MPVPVRNKELLTEEVQDIINCHPHWIVRRGYTIVFLLLLVLLGLSWLIRYPDKINAAARLVAINPQVAVDSKLTGKIARLLVTNGQAVKKDQVLVCIENSTEYNAVMKLQFWINEATIHLENGEYLWLSKNTAPVLKGLGEIQADYSVFQNQCKEGLNAGEQSLQQIFYSLLPGLKYKAERWMQKHVITAPEDGTVIFISSILENDLVSNGQILFYIKSQHPQFYTELQIGQKGLGKVKVGQKVIIRTESYPDNEFGYLSGVVSNISDTVSQDNSFLIKADLLNGLKTNYGHTLFFRNGLQASGEIITDNRRLFHRLTGQLRKMIN